MVVKATIEFKAENQATCRLFRKAATLQQHGQCAGAQVKGSLVRIVADSHELIAERLTYGMVRPK